MGKQVLRLLLGAGYVVLVTWLLLYQMGMAGERRNSAVAVLGTLVLGIALAVVLVLYIRVTDQIKGQRQSAHNAQEKDNLSETGQRAGEQQAAEIEDGGQEYNQKAGSYEEIYESFLKTTQGYRLSERELEVAWLLYRGYTNRQIGEELYIAETTVKKHVSHIYQKMEVYGRKDFRIKVQRGE